MVIISAAICDKSGDILVARQFQNITKHQLEENIRNFPKLIAQDQQHTFVDTEYLRYVYLPLDSMYLVLLTKKTSNIIEDQETIRLLHKIIQELCPSGVSEANVLNRDFDILLCFDDVISFGFRESVSLTQVQSSLEMESAEEKLHIMLMKQKQAEQQEAAKKHQMEVEKRRSQKGGASGSSNSISSSSYGSYSSAGAATQGTGMSSTLNQSSDAFKPSKTSGEDEGVYRPDESASKQAYNSKATTIAPKKSMVLGKKAKAISNSKESSKTKNQTGDSDTSAAAKELKQQLEKENETAKAEIKVNPLKAPVEIEILEKLSCQISRDGNLISFDVNGDILLQFGDPSKARVALQFEHENLKLSAMKPHLNLNKQLWLEKKQIALKNTETPFPVNTRIPSVKYRYSSTNASDLPFTLTCWFTDGALALEAEFNAEQERIQQLSDVTLTFVFPQGENPNVTAAENAEYLVEGNTFKYTIPHLNSTNPSSNIQISFSSNLSEDELYPLDVNFSLPYTFFKIKPLAAANIGDNMQLLKFEVSSKCQADKYQVN